MMKPRLVLCSGAQPPPDISLRNGQRIIELDTLKPKSNTRLCLYNVTDAFARNLPERLVDLLEIATYVYTADCEASRELAWYEGKSTEPWSRDFHFIIPVRDLTFWQRGDVQDSLVNALVFLSSDKFSFDFLPLAGDREVNQYLEIGDEDLEPLKGAERVIMFSGGLDSLAGAVESAVIGEPLILVSHTPVSTTKSRQKKLYTRLREIYKVPMMHIPVWVNKSGFDREPTQRTRSFLFSALGTTVAKVMNISGVRFYENGVISLNLPLAEEAIRSRASRTTNPWSLHLLQEFYKLVVEQDDFVIDNPYIFSTKTEVVKNIVKGGAAELIGLACSCSRTMFRPVTQQHCGLCGQCIDRRIAICASKQEDNDPDTNYESCVYTGARPISESPYNHNIAANYVRFAREIQNLNEAGVLSRYSSELTRAARPFENKQEATQKFIAMHKRHAESVCTVLVEQLKMHSLLFVNHSISRDSLLYMAVERQPEQVIGPLNCENGNVFRKTGDFWTIVYDGKKIQLNNIKGVRYIAFLLDKCNQKFLALHLVMQDNGQFPEPDPLYSDMSAEELAAEGLDSIGFSIQEIDRARSSVTQAIRTAIKHICKDHPALHDHLNTSLNLGRYVSYRPSTPISWEL